MWQNRAKVRALCAPVKFFSAGDEPGVRDTLGGFTLLWWGRHSCLSWLDEW